jgi:hypothetical protein
MFQISGLRFHLSPFIPQPLNLRSLNHRTSRQLSRYATRMLGGACRPDWLAIGCRLIGLILKIDDDLRPYMQEQIRLQEQRQFDQRLQAAIQRVYGLPSSDPNPQLSTLRPPTPDGLEIDKESVNKRSPPAPFNHLGRCQFLLPD